MPSLKPPSGRSCPSSRLRPGSHGEQVGDTVEEARLRDAQQPRDCRGGNVARYDLETRHSHGRNNLLFSLETAVGPAAAGKSSPRTWFASTKSTSDAVTLESNSEPRARLSFVEILPRPGSIISFVDAAECAAELGTQLLDEPSSSGRLRHRRAVDLSRQLRRVLAQIADAPRRAGDSGARRFRGGGFRDPPGAAGRISRVPARDSPLPARPRRPRAQALPARPRSGARSRGASALRHPERLDRATGADPRADLRDHRRVNWPPFRPDTRLGKGRLGYIPGAQAYVGRRPDDRGHHGRGAPASMDH
jgi:hypothetical protein